MPFRPRGGKRENQQKGNVKEETKEALLGIDIRGSGNVEANDPLGMTKGKQQLSIIGRGGQKQKSKSGKRGRSRSCKGTSVGGLEKETGASSTWRLSSQFRKKVGGRQNLRDNALEILLGRYISTGARRRRGDGAWKSIGC